MRSIFVFVALLSLVLLPCLGCGGGTPDTTDAGPDVEAPTDALDPTMAGGLPEDPSADPMSAGESAAAPGAADE